MGFEYIKYYEFGGREFAIEIDYNYYKGDPGVSTGPWEDSYPPEDSSADINSFKILDENGQQIKLASFPPEVQADIESILEGQDLLDELAMEGGGELAGRDDDAADRKMDEMRDEEMLRGMASKKNSGMMNKIASKLVANKLKPPFKITSTEIRIK